MKIKEYAQLHEKPFYQEAKDAYGKIKTHGDVIGLIRSGMEAAAELAALTERVRVLEQALEQQQEWRCPNCRAMNYGDCWKCGSHQPAALAR